MTEMHISPNVTYPVSKGRTKWEILTARRMELRRALSDMDRTLSGLENTTCGLTCSGCGTVLATEADFAQHFIVTDERYLNLGDCPNSKRK